MIIINDYIVIHWWNRCGHPHHWPLDVAPAVSTHLVLYSSSVNTTWDGNEWWTVSSNMWPWRSSLNLSSDTNLKSSFHFALAADSSGVLRFFLVQGHVPVSGRVSPQFPHWFELSLLCHSVPLTPLQGFLGLYAFVILPLSAVMVVLFPLVAGWGGTVSVIVMKTVPQAFAMSEFTPIVITGPGWPPRSLFRAFHC